MDVLDEDFQGDHPAVAGLILRVGFVEIHPLGAYVELVSRKIKLFHSEQVDQLLRQGVDFIPALVAAVNVDMGRKVGHVLGLGGLVLDRHGPQGNKRQHRFLGHIVIDGQSCMVLSKRPPGPYGLALLGNLFMVHWIAFFTSWISWGST
jgi:hypothetical protein